MKHSTIPAHAASVWARPGMRVVFRAELMPGRDSSSRTYRVARVLPSRRVLLEGAAGEHAEAEFEHRPRYRNRIANR